MSLLARPRVLFSIIVTLLLTVFGIIFLKGPLEIPPLQVDPFVEIFGYPLRATVIQQWLAMAVILEPRLRRHAQDGCHPGPDAGGGGDYR